MNTEKLLSELYAKNIIFKINNEYHINPSVDLSAMDISLGFDHIAIKQGRSRCDSRLDAQIESEVIRGITRPVPLIASNMSTVTDSSFCTKLYNLGALGVMHRALPEEDLIAEIKSIAEQCDTVCASVGVGNNQVGLAKKLIEAGANVIFIDIAHGYSQSVIDTAKSIRRYSSLTKIVVGNTTNPDMLEECQSIADCCKCGIGQGCFHEGTRISTDMGTKNIENIQIGEYVKTHKNRYRKVIETTQREEKQKLFHINGVKCTGNHEFYVLHKKYKEIANDDNINEYAEWISAEKLNNNYFLLKIKE